MNKWISIAASAALILVLSACTTDGTDGVDGIDGVEGIAGLNGTDGVDGVDGKGNINFSNFVPIELSASSSKWDATAPWKLPVGFTQTIVSDG